MSWNRFLVVGAFAASTWARCDGQATASAQAESDRTKPPAEAVLVTTVSAKGVQIYRCEQRGGAAMAWVFIAPEATLFTGAEPVGTHGAGPVWRWKDGSAVVGKLVAKQDAPGRQAIPWLLLSATLAPGGAAAGQLAGIGYVRRAETQGGAAPVDGCDGAHLRTEARVPYTAIYEFYRVPGR